MKLIIFALTIILTTSPFAIAEDAFPANRVAATGDDPNAEKPEGGPQVVEAGLGPVASAGGKPINGSNGGAGSGCLNCTAADAKLRGAVTNPAVLDQPGYSSGSGSTSNAVDKKQ